MFVERHSRNGSSHNDNHRFSLVIYRPHSNIWFKNTVGRVLKRNPLPNKYAPLLEYLLNSGVSLHFASHLSEINSISSIFLRMRDSFELFVWCLLNQISLRKVGLIFTRSSLEKKDVLFLMHYGNFAYETEVLDASGMELARFLAGINIPKVVHLTHYAYSAVSGSRNLAALKPRLLVAENNLVSNSKYFIKYFNQIPGDFYTLPYTPATRFQERKPIKQRLNKLVVTGSITYKMKDPEFIDFYQVNELQPLRRLLYEQANDYLGEMDCMISDLDASRSVKKARTDSIFRRIWSLVSQNSGQKEYYKKDIVDIYNHYTMFAVPEEVCDLPAIGFVEGMACGTAYFGVSNPMYGDIGMVAGVHYISYDGTVSHLMSQVRYYQQHPLELAQIASDGCRFVRERLCSQMIYKNFLDRLQSLIHAGGKKC